MMVERRAVAQDSAKREHENASTKPMGAKLPSQRAGMSAANVCSSFYINVSDRSECVITRRSLLLMSHSGEAYSLKIQPIAIYKP